MMFPTTPGSHRRARTRSTKALLASAAVALSGVLATIGAPADRVAAGEPPPPPGTPAGEDETISVHGGYAKFRHYGDILEVNDGVLDGRGVRVELDGLGSSEVGHHVVSDYAADGEPVRVNLDLPEHEEVGMRVCYTVDHVTTKCSDGQRAVT